MSPHCQSDKVNNDLRGGAALLGNLDSDALFYSESHRYGQEGKARRQYRHQSLRNVITWRGCNIFFLAGYDC